MKWNQHLLLPLLMTGALFITATAWAKGGETVRVGKTATITFAHETQVDNVMLKPGDYTVKHRVVGGDQYMVFQRVEAADPEYDLDGGGSIGKPIQVQCRMEPLGAKVSDTTASFDREGNIDKLTKIDIGGENVEHLF